MNTPKMAFTRVIDLDTKETGDVEEILSTQVTVWWDDGRFGFLMFSDRGREWDILKEKKS